MKFLVINHPRVPVPKRAPIEGCVDYFTRFVTRRKATVYPMVGPKSYATIIDVDSGEDLNKVLSDNPMAPNEEYWIYPLSDLDSILGNGDDVQERIRTLPIVKLRDRSPGMDFQKFLVIGKVAKPLPHGANIKGSLEQLRILKERGRAEAYAIVGMEGFVAIMEVSNNDELNDILYKNPLGRWGEYSVYPLGTFAGERRTLTEIGLTRSEMLQEAQGVSTIG
jgi:muconolactone delta-isomerase